MSPPAHLPVVFLFAGQGSQYHRMGHELYRGNEVFRAALDRFDRVAAAELGYSVRDRIFDPAKGRHEALVDTEITHPGIVMVELALAEMLRADGIEPDYVLGTSLGEYAAAVVAGSLTAEDCLRLLIGQARIMRSGPRGGMLAVLAGAEVLDAVPELRACEIAARNYPGNFLVSGTREAIAAAEAALRTAGVPHLPLPVEYGYHSRQMEPVLDACGRGFDGVPFRPPRIPWVSSVDGELVTRPDAGHFRRVARRPIEFELTMARMRERGEFRYLDLGPSGNLHNFIRENLPDGTGSESLPLLSPFGNTLDLVEAARTRLVRGTVRRANTMKVYGFPGQGAQRRGMGTGLFERFSELIAVADRVLGYSIAELCTTDPQRRLGRTEFTQPALYVVEALAYLDRAASDPVPPDYLAGHSLGEYAALFAAGAFDFETGLRLVQRRGELMAAAGGGTMAAVIGIDEQAVARVLATPGFEVLDLANYNAPDQVVVSGPVEAIELVCPAFEAAGARTVRLNVSAPLHSRYLRPVAEEFGRFLDSVELREPRIPVLANVDAQPYTMETLKRGLIAQIASPVRWTETVRRLMGYGEFEFVELGPGQVLTKLVTRIRAAADPIAPTASAPTASGTVELGAAGFRDRYGLRFAYVIGSMHGGVSGRDLVRSAEKAGLLGFLGIDGLPIDEAGRQIAALAEELGPGSAYGVSLRFDHRSPRREADVVDLLLRHRVPLVEASGYPLITEELVRYRLHGGRIMAKVSRSDIAAEFLQPPPRALVDRLLAAGAVTRDQADAAAGRPMADELCAEANGARQTGADLLTLLPAVVRLRDEAARPEHAVHVGGGGGLGTPEAVAAAFLLGADFVLTGSVNQCSVEAATSDDVKDLLAGVGEYDVAAGPAAGDLFELGGRASYLSRGVFFPARAAKLYDLWRGHHTLAELDDATRMQVLDRFLGGAAGADAQGKTELAELFQGYFARGHRLALAGEPRFRTDYLVQCGPAMGAFNQAVAGTSLTSWRARTVDAIAETLMGGAAAYIAAHPHRWDARTGEHR
jgi:trans-AT polyketide synthase, acyltransferase and oxidoreductase domains